MTGNNQDRQSINIPWRYEVIHFETVSKALDREASKSHLSLFEALFVGSIRTVVSLSLFWLRLVNLPRYVKIGSRRLFTSCCLMINGLSCSGWCRHWGVCSYKHVDDLLFFSYDILCQPPLSRFKLVFGNTLERGCSSPSVS